ncbi:hypothetical protein [Planctomicrobium piriforme]|uniref:Uncharacterized protein n=1 Tax=Planctomicrobium piriforme TaxID=1576369 RepID=A0A1I3LZE2_9PLAN|nr:hypothetical protein [Planctomicrobium piriforme]SFI90082.1 hypothetical protein SAMN05421753_113113 [Planctomicrobium piriforme]
MTKMPKHADLMILGAAVLAVLGGVLLFDRSRLSARDVSGTLDGDAALYQSEKPISREPEDEPAKPTVKVTQNPAWLDSEDGAAQPGTRSIPTAYEKGVVHLGPGASLGGKRPFPDDNYWNQPIDDLEVDPLSEVYINEIGCDRNLHPDFGAGMWNGAPIGIPYVVVSGDHQRYPIKYTAYGDQSDPGPYPVPRDAPIEGDPNVDGDRHVIVLDRDNWKLYELFRGFPVANGQLWKAESGAIFDMKTNDRRPEGWTSADAAGLPIFPGLVRYDEVVEQKEINHALRFTVSRTRNAYVAPASHYASRLSKLSLPPMGMRVRLKKDFDITPYPEEAQVILKTLKKYGMILADNGSDWFISGAPDPRWNDDNIHTLKKLHGCDFEVVTMQDPVEEEACNCPEEKEALKKKLSIGNARELLPTLDRDSLLK